MNLQDKVVLAKGLLDVLELNFDELDELEDHVLSKMELKYPDRSQEASTAPETIERHAKAVIQSPLCPLNQSRVDSQASTPLPSFGELALPDVYSKTWAPPRDGAYDLGMQDRLNVQNPSSSTSKCSPISPDHKHQNAYQQTTFRRQFTVSTNDTHSCSASEVQRTHQQNNDSQEGRLLGNIAYPPMSLGAGNHGQQATNHQQIRATRDFNVSYPPYEPTTQSPSIKYSVPHMEAEQPQAVPAFVDPMPFAKSWPSAPAHCDSFNNGRNDPQHLSLPTARIQAPTRGLQTELGNQIYPTYSLSRRNNVINSTNHGRRHWRSGSTSPLSSAGDSNNLSGLHDCEDDKPSPSKRPRFDFALGERTVAPARLQIPSLQSPAKSSCGYWQLPICHTNADGPKERDPVDATYQTLRSPMAQQSAASIARTSPPSLTRPPSIDGKVFKSINTEIEANSPKTPTNRVCPNACVSTTSYVKKKKKQRLSDFDDMYDVTDDEDEDLDHFNSVMEPDWISESSAPEDDGISSRNEGLVKCFRLAQGKLITESATIEDEACPSQKYVAPSYGLSTGDNEYTTVTDTGRNTLNSDDMQTAQAFQSTVQHSVNDFGRSEGQASPAYAPTSPSYSTSEPKDMADCDSNAAENSSDTEGHETVAKGVNGYPIPPNVQSPPMMPWDINPVPPFPQQLSNGPLLFPPLSPSQAGSMGDTSKGPTPRSGFTRCKTCKNLGVDRVVLHGGDCQDPNKTGTGETDNKEEKETPGQVQETAPQRPSSFVKLTSIEPCNITKPHTTTPLVEPKKSPRTLTQRQVRQRLTSTPQTLRTTQFKHVGLTLHKQLEAEEVS